MSSETTTPEDLSKFMHALMDMHKSAKIIRGVMRSKGWDDADSADEVKPANEFEKNLWEWMDATAYPGCEHLSCEDIATNIFRELKDRGAAIG